jgi:DNA polymerase-4
MNSPTIAHVDMDAFYVSVELRDNPDLRGRPVVVGGSATGRGVVSAASYEAREFGVFSAMPTREALRRCPDLIVLPGRMTTYVEVSRQIMGVLDRFSPLVEQLSVDEAFVDLTGTERSLGPAPDIARCIKREIAEATGGLTASVGVAPVKFVSKIASDLEKPDGLVIVEPGHVLEFLHPLPLRRLWGAGPKSVARMEAMGLHTIGDLAAAEPATIERAFGASGSHMTDLANGRDPRRIVPKRAARSHSHEVTFDVDRADRPFLLATLLDHASSVARRLRRCGVRGRTVTLKIRDGSFRTRTRQQSLGSAVDDAEDIYRTGVALFDAVWDGFPVRLIGLGVSGLVELEDEPPTLFESKTDQKQRELNRTLDALGDQFGENKLVRGGVLRKASTRTRPPKPS